MFDIRKINHGYWWNAQNKYENLINNRNNLTELTVQVTDRCNRHCKKCNKTNFTFTDMKTTDVIRIIKEACDLGLQHIHFTGGEPTMHEDLPYIVAVCREKGLRVDMSSNGNFSFDTLSQIAKNGLNSINISWDYLEEPPECINFIFDFDMDIFLNHMVMPSNYKELELFLRLISMKFPKIIDIQLMPPRGDAEKFTKEQIKIFNDDIALKCYEASEKFPMVHQKVSEMLRYDNADKGIYHEWITWQCHRAKSELRVGTKGFSTCTYLYRDGHITCGLDKSVKEALEMCKKECNYENIPPIKEMCQFSCSPEVAGFNYFVDKGAPRDWRT